VFDIRHLIFILAPYPHALSAQKNKVSLARDFKWW
jgi:hypothetical protein